MRDRRFQRAVLIAAIGDHGGKATFGQLVYASEEGSKRMTQMDLDALIEEGWVFVYIDKQRRKFYTTKPMKMEQPSPYSD